MAAHYIHDGQTALKVNATVDGQFLYRFGDTISSQAIVSFTNELAQDAVGNILTDSSTIDFTYNDGLNTITAAVIVAGLSGLTASQISDFTEAAQDAVGFASLDSTTIDVIYTDASNTFSWAVISQMSITSDASGIKLSGDATSPGNYQFYGTGSTGTKGWFGQVGAGLFAVSGPTAVRTYTFPDSNTTVLTTAAAVTRRRPS